MPGTSPNVLCRPHCGRWQDSSTLWSLVLHTHRCSQSSTGADSRTTSLWVLKPPERQVPCSTDNLCTFSQTRQILSGSRALTQQPRHLGMPTLLVQVRAHIRSSHLLTWLKDSSTKVPSMWETWAESWALGFHLTHS